MAKAVAYCTCATCENEFCKETTKNNRKEADLWVEWAEANYNQCPACYGKEQREKELASPPVLTVSLLPYNTKHPILLSWSGNTIDVKDQIKSLGYKWDDVPSNGIFGALSTKRPQKSWYMLTSLEELKSKLNDAKSITGVTIKNNVSQADLITYQVYVKNTESKAAEMKQEVETLGEQPKKPECYPVGRWNGRIYGKSGVYRIRLSKNIFNRTILLLQ
ncbi:hypothetical protein [Paenibacillus xylaniclasticus]|uniref:hypothetical protein n=1 Tax=Paenibacillus xylaniclasticus TaxID=588083 RepID=UPI000FDA7D16|nr:MULTISPECIES: hypothetical protein [Paenibacillus]GFN32559.1 hypothetical protein PCURB6_28190 [Paenibacillus curdlanolyticus]